MNMESKTRKILTIILIIMAIILVIGISYAVWRYNFFGNANTMNTSNIKLELLESTDEIINITNALPISDDEGKSQAETFNFAVTTETNANKNIGYSLIIEKLSVDNGYTPLNDNQVKIYLTNYSNAELLAPTKISRIGNYVFFSKTNSHNSTNTRIQDKFKLRTWIDYGVDASNWNENTKLQYKFKIGVGEYQEVSIIPSFVYSWSTSNVYPGDSLSSISGYVADYTTLNKNHFLKHNIGSAGTVESQEVCYILNSEVYCLKGGDGGASFNENKATLLASFGESNCSVYSDGVDCSLSGLSAYADAYGFVIANDVTSDCYVDDSGNAYCR